MSPPFARALNSLGLFGITAILGMAFYYQFARDELPCPLCLLQRIGFIAAGSGLVLNIVFGSRPSHYGVAILGALLGGAISTRQILLHIAPGTGSYGSALFGVHFYSLALIAFFGIVVAAAAMLMFERQFADWTSRPQPVRPRGLELAAIGLFTAMTLMEALSTIAECGAGMCPDNPTGYQLLTPAPAPAPS